MSNFIPSRSGSLVFIPQDLMKTLLRPKPQALSKSSELGEIELRESADQPSQGLGRRHEMRRVESTEEV